MGIIFLGIGLYAITLLLEAFIDIEIMFSRNKKSQEEKEKEEKQEIEHDKNHKDFMNGVEKDVKRILKKNSQQIIQAYIKTVKENSFGEKNYNKFFTEFEKFLENKSTNLKKLNKLYENPKYNDLEYTITVDEEGIKLYEMYWDEYVEWFEDGILFKSPVKHIERKIKKMNADINYSDDMDPFEYEHLCAGEFNKNNWEAKATQGSSDQGVDVIAKKDGKTLVAQCKRFTKPVGNKAVQEVVAGMKYYEATEGVVIAPNGFTNSAKNLAKANNIKLIHHNEINSL